MLTLLVLASGCSDISPVEYSRATFASTLEDARANQGQGGLRLLAYPVQSEVGDPDSLIVGYIIYNGGGTASVNIQPDFFRFHMTSADTQYTFRELDADLFYGGDYSTDLSAEEFVGRFARLGCSTCTHSFRLTSPGTYQIVVEYSTPPEPDNVDNSSADQTRLRSEAFTINYAPTRRIQRHEQP